MKPYVLVLPWGPSVNDYYLNRSATVRKGPKAGKRYVARMLSPEGNLFRGQIRHAVRHGHRAPPLLAGRLSITVVAFPPKLNRIRDLDNLLKPALDAMKHAGVFVDDVLFDEVIIRRGNADGKGRMVVAISAFDPDEALAASLRAGIPSGELCGLALFDQPVAERGVGDG